MSTTPKSKRKPWTIYFREDLKAALVAIEPQSTSKLLEKITEGYMEGRRLDNIVAGCLAGEQATALNQTPVGDKKTETFTVLTSNGEKTLEQMIEGHPIMTSENTRHGGAGS